MATLPAAVIPIVWSSLSGRSKSPAIDQATSAPLAGEETEVSAALTEPAAQSSEVTDLDDVLMVLVPAGEFTMGSDDIDVYETTNSLYAECVDEGICQLPTYTGSETRGQSIRGLVSLTPSPDSFLLASHVMFCLRASAPLVYRKWDFGS